MRPADSQTAGAGTGGLVDSDAAPAAHPAPEVPRGSAAGHLWVRNLHEALDASAKT